MSENLTSDFVTGVHIFPIKSCHEATVDGEPPSRLSVGLTGFESYGAIDRGWLIADNEALFVSQRGWDGSQAVKFPGDRELATVMVDILKDRLHVYHEDFGDLDVPTDTSSDAVSQRVRIHSSELSVYDEGEEASEFFSDILHRPVRLYKADRNSFRFVPKEYRREGTSNTVAGADGFPFLLTSQASLDQVVGEAGLPPDSVILSRYRGNIEIDGRKIGPFGEDHALKVRIGNMGAYIVKACSRCPIPNIDQNTGIRDNLSTKILRSRMGWTTDSDLEDKPKPYFGQNLNHLFEPGLSVGVGDEVNVIESGSPNVILK